MGPADDGLSVCGDREKEEIESYPRAAAKWGVTHNTLQILLLIFSQIHLTHTDPGIGKLFNYGPRESAAFPK